MSNETARVTPSLKDVYAPYFLVGAAINGTSVATQAINHKGMATILKTQFNSTTLSNLMKPVYLLDREASAANPDGMPVCKFDSVDPALAFCRDNGIKMRGHTLVWYHQTPGWFFCEDYDPAKGQVDAATMERRLESYIRQTITYCQEKYPGVIYCWDVVNEAINDNGTWRSAKNGWYATIGESYVEKAFAFARKYAAPGVGLFYNDYNVFLPAKREAIFKMAENLKAKGLIDGFGLQPTVGLWTPALDSPDPSSFRTALERYATLGLQIQITELGFDLGGEDRSEGNLDQQTSRFKEMMALLLREDADNGGPCNIISVTVFGICDDYPLYPEFRQCIYLWDRDCIPKDAFYAYLAPGLKALKNRESGAAQ